MRVFINLLNILSKLGSILVVFSMLFILQYISIGQIPIINNIVIFNKFYLCDILFVIFSLILTLKYTTVHSPYESFLSKY